MRKINKYSERLQDTEVDLQMPLWWNLVYTLDLKSSDSVRSHAGANPVRGTRINKI